MEGKEEEEEEEEGRKEIATSERESALDGDSDGERKKLLDAEPNFPHERRASFPSSPSFPPPSLTPITAAASSVFPSSRPLLSKCISLRRRKEEDVKEDVEGGEYTMGKEERTFLPPLQIHFPFCYQPIGRIGKQYRCLLLFLLLFFIIG